MKLLSNEHKYLAIFVMLIILNSFSISKCQLNNINDLPKLSYLLELRKDSRKFLEKEYEYFKLKFEKPEFEQIQEFLEKKEYFENIYKNLSSKIENIQKLFSNSSSWFHKNITKNAWANFLEKQISSSKLDNNYYTHKKRAIFSNLNIKNSNYLLRNRQIMTNLENPKNSNLLNMSQYLNFNYLHILTYWEDKINVIFDQMFQNFPDSIYSFKIFKLKLLE
jgi:hypothetical protein